MNRKNFMKKLGSLVLTAGMALALVTPVNTYAATDNRVNTVVSVAKETELTDDAPTLILELDDDLRVGTVFYLELKNAEWLIDDVTAEVTNIGGTAVLDVDQVDSDVISITLQSVTEEDGSSATYLPTDALIRVKLASKVKKATASVIIDAEGTTITSNSSGIEYAKVNTNGATGKISEVKSFTEDCELGDITIEESYAGLFASELNKSGDFVFTLKLDNSDVEFLSARGITVTGTKGLIGVTGTATLEDDDEIEITVDGDDLDGLEKGGFKISGLEIGTIDDEPTAGSVGIDIESDAFKTISMQVAKIVKTGISVDVTLYSSDVKGGLVAGRTGTYKFDITEATEDVLLDGKRLDFDLENGYFMDADTTNSKTALNEFENEITLPNELELESVTLDDTKITGFSVTVTADEDEIEDFSLKVPVTVDLKTIEDTIFDITETSSASSDTSTSTTDDGGTSVTFGGGDTTEDTITTTTTTTSTKDKKDIPDVKMTVSGRAISGDEIEVDVAKVIQPITVGIEEKVLKLGLKDQEGTDIVITETDPEMLQKGTVYIAFDDSDGVTFSNPPTVEVTKGDIKLGAGELVRSNNAITGFKFNVTKQSRTVSEITISGLTVTVDRTVPEGKIGILVGGSSLTDSDPVASDTYVKITDKNSTDSSTQVNDTLQNQINQIQQTIQTQGETPLTVVFTVGSNTYTVNGQTRTMDGAPYLSAAGRTMVPVRYVADAVGVSPDKILSNSGIITILGKTDTIQFKLNSNIMIKSGSQIPMDEKAVLTDGRTYVPVSYAATALGITSKYDAAARTVTFTNSAATTATTIPTEDNPATTSTNTVSDINASDLYNVIDSIQ